MLACLCGAAPAQPSAYVVNDHLTIHVSDGATLSGVMVRRAGVTKRLPTALQFTIYAQPADDIARMKYAADRGYVAVTAYSRGKAGSPEAVAPYECDGRDAAGVVDWIAAQPWSDGAVGMYGGSYNSFAQWAAAKHRPRALRALMLSVANAPGTEAEPRHSPVHLPDSSTTALWPATAWASAGLWSRNRLM